MRVKPIGKKTVLKHRSLWPDLLGQTITALGLIFVLSLFLFNKKLFKRIFLILLTLVSFSNEAMTANIALTVASSAKPSELELKINNQGTETAYNIKLAWDKNNEILLTPKLPSSSHVEHKISWPETQLNLIKNNKIIPYWITYEDENAYKASAPQLAILGESPLSLLSPQSGSEFSHRVDPDISSIVSLQLKNDLLEKVEIKDIKLHIPFEIMGELIPQVTLPITLAPSENTRVIVKLKNQGGLWGSSYTGFLLVKMNEQTQTIPWVLSIQSQVIPFREMWNASLTILLGVALLGLYFKKST